MIGPLPEDIIQERDFERGTRMLLSAIARYRDGTLGPKDTPTNIRWRGYGSAFVTIPGSRSHQRTMQAIARATEKRETAERNRVSRDPCPVCNTRRDIGCKHMRAA